jgi:general secretion pathway protein J
MSARGHSGCDAEAGFSLVEVLAAVALVGVILSSLALITGQWLPASRRAYDRLQRSESLMIAFDRVAADISAAEFVKADRSSKAVLFDGTETAVTLVRTSVGPNGDSGLELVRIGETEDLRGPAVTRARVAYVPGASDVDTALAAVVLLRPPYRLNFAFAGRDGTWRNDWLSADTLPAAVRVTIRDTKAQRQPIIRIVPVRAKLTAEDFCGKNGCEGGEAPELTASSSHPDGEPPTLEQVNGGGRAR